MEKSDKDWKKILTPEQFEICRNKGTEHPFSGKYNYCKEKGIYKCVCCGVDLFSSDTKFDSGTGWPSFWEPIKNNVKSETDTSYDMLRIEVMCKNCNAHLGHVFDDGPITYKPGYCINSASLKLEKSLSCFLKVIPKLPEY